MKLLLIEDEHTLLETMLAYLTAQGYLCETAANYREALDRIDFHEYDCVIVDIGLPYGSGLDIVRELKTARSKAGIIIISAKNSLNDKITGLELGSDDYLTKPFHLSELSARIAAIIRRRKFDGDKQIIFNEIRITPGEKAVTVNSLPVELTLKEYKLLLYFVVNKGRVVTKAALAQHIWGDHYDSMDSFDFLYSHIKNLRKKLLEAGADDYIKTVYGMGYKLTTS